MGKGGSKVAATAESKSNFDISELDKLPQDIRERLLGEYNRHKQEYEDLNANYERLKVDSEQKYFEVEKELTASAAKLQNEIKSATELRQQVADLEQKHGDSSSKLWQSQENLLEKERLMGDLDRDKRQAEAEKEELAQMLERKNREIDRLNEEWSAMSVKVNEANVARVQALAELDEKETQGTSAQYRETRLQQEKDSLEQRVEWMEKELRENTNEMLNIRKEQSAKVLELQATLEEKVDELRHHEERSEALKLANEEQTKKLESYMEKLRESQDLHAQMEEQYRNEVQAQEKLIKIYKASTSEAEGKVREMTVAVEELQNLVKQATAAHTDVQKQREGDADQYNEQLRARDLKISQMEKELVNANELLEASKRRGVPTLSADDIEAMSPSAAAASRLLKSGMSLTQIYSEYVQSSEALYLEKEENKRLNQYLDQIMQEIDEKAPIMKKQREDYEKSLETISQLTRQLDSAMLECEKLRITSDDNTRRCTSFNRENNRLKQQTVDLGQQVRMLLKELEEARGTVVTSYPELVSSSEVSSSSQLISEKLVTFRSIEELQEQNQKLLEVVRDLSDKKEEDEKLAGDAKTQELKKQLDLVLEELNEMQQARERQDQMMESIVRQRDMYRVLLAQTGDSPLPIPRPQVASTPMQASPMVESQLSPGRPLASPRQSILTEEKKSLDEAKEALKEMQEEFSLYRREKAKNEQVENEQLDKFRKESSDFRVQNAKLSSQLEFSNERYKILQSNIEGYKKEIAALRDKNQKFSTNVIKHEQTITMLKQDLMGTQEKLSRAEVSGQNYKSERDILKNVELRLIQEKENLLRNQKSQNLLLANLQAIQNNLERSEFEMKTKLQHQIEVLDKENAALKRKIDTIDNQHRNVAVTMERQANEMRQQRDEEVENHKKTKTQLASVEANLLTVKNEHSKLQAEHSAMEIKVINLQKQVQPDRSLEEQLKDVQTQLEQARTYNVGLEEQLERANQHVNEYKAMANTFEQNMKEANETSKQFQEATEKQLAEAKEAADKVEKQINSIEKEKQELVSENIKVSEESQQLNVELKQQLAQVHEELNQAREKLDTAIATEQAARQDSQDQGKIAREAQEKYERELMLHSSDVEALTSVKQELQSLQDKFSQIEEEAKRATQILNSSKESWGQQEALYKGEVEKVTGRLQELQTHNNTLHQELESLSDQMVAIQQANEQDSMGASELAESLKKDDTGRSPDQLLEVIRYQRREKETAESRLAVVQAEATRHEQKASHLEKQLAEVNASVDEIRNQAQTSIQTAAQHADLMRKVENLNLLTDSNKLLREERDRLVVQLQQAETKVAELESEMGPIKERVGTVTAHCEALTQEKTAMQGEIDRWKARTNHLIEQCNKADPEEQKRLTEERDKLQKQITGMTEESHKHKAEISQLTSSLKSVRGELAQTKQQVQKLNGEIAELKKSVSSKDEELDKKDKNITQLRNIGRKYKKQFDEAQKEVEKLKSATTMAELTSAQESLKATEAKLQASEQNLKTTEEKLQTTENNMKTLKDKCEATEKELALITETLGSAEYEKGEANKQVTQLQTSLKTHIETITKLQEEATKLREGETKAMNLLRNTGPKLKAQRDNITTLTNENKELKQNIEEANLRLSSIKSQMEAKVKGLEKQLSESSGQSDQQQPELARLQKENSELQHKLQNLQKQLATQLKQQSPQINKPTVSAQPVERTSASSEAPRTANIRPMAAQPSSGRSVQSAPVQPVRGTSAETRAMASIRPMAVAPTTPTATVMPTTMSSQEGESMPVSVAVTPTSQVRPTQQVQPVSPQTQQVLVEEVEPQPQQIVDPVVQDLPVMIEPEPTITPIAVATPTQQIATPTQQIATPTPQIATHVAAAMPSTSRDTPPQTSSKRSREETDEEEDTVGDVNVKRKKTQEEAVVEPIPQETQPEVVEVIAQPLQQVQAEPQEEQTIGVALVEPAQQHPAQTTQVELSTPAQLAGQVDTAESEEQPATEEEVVGVEEGQEEVIEEEELPVSQDDSDDVIVVEEEEEDPGYEEEEGEEGEEYDDEDEGDEGMEGEGEYDDEEEEDYGEGMEEEEYEGDEEEMQEGEEGQEEGEEEEDDDCVVIVEDDEEGADAVMEDESQQPASDQPAPTVQSASHPASTAAEVPRQPPALTTRGPGRTERLPSVGRAQLTPFMSLQAQAGPFEEGDDSIVPSTPTLFVPKRNDGFAEAVSSPQVPHGRFVFGAAVTEAAGGLSQPDFGQLATQALMDDTRMDLSAFDDGTGTGRSVPTTPRSRTPPTISITEAPPEGDTQQAEADTAVAALQQQEGSEQTSVEESASTSEIQSEAVPTESEQTGAPGEISDQPTETKPTSTQQEANQSGTGDQATASGSAKAETSGGEQRPGAATRPETGSPGQARARQLQRNKPRITPISYPGERPGSAPGQAQGTSQQRKFRGGTPQRRGQTARRGQPMRGAMPTQGFPGQYQQQPMRGMRGTRGGPRGGRGMQHRQQQFH